MKLDGLVEEKESIEKDLNEQLESKQKELEAS